MRRLGKHTTYEFQTHIELDAPSVMYGGPESHNSTIDLSLDPRPIKIRPVSIAWVIVRMR